MFIKIEMFIKEEREERGLGINLLPGTYIVRINRPSYIDLYFAGV